MRVVDAAAQRRRLCNLLHPLAAWIETFRYLRCPWSTRRPTYRSRHGFRAGAAVLSAAAAVVHADPQDDVSVGRISVQSPSLPDHEAPPEHGQARTFDACVAGLEAYDRSVPALQWHQEVDYVHASTNGELVQTPFHEGRFALSLDGRWFCAGTQTTTDTGVPVKSSATYYCDGLQVWTSNGDGTRGLIRGVTRSEIVHFMETPIMLIGRTVDFTEPGFQMSRLADLLRRTTDRAVDGSRAPCVSLAGSVDMGGWKRVEVTLDRDKGFMPVSIRLVDEFHGVRKLEMVVTAAQEVGSVWIPTEGWREVHAVVAVNDAAMARLSADDVRAAIGQLDLSVREQRFRAREIMRDAVGAEPFVGQMLGGGRHLLKVTEIDAMSTEAEQRIMTPTLNEGMTLIMERTGDVYRVSGGRPVRVDQE